MPRYPGKRKSDAVTSDTNSHENGDFRASKISRTTVPDLPVTTPGQRFGETADYIPLESADYIPLTQVSGADEDDAQAEDLVQGTQGVDESSVSSATLYGKIPLTIPLNLPSQQLVLDEECLTLYHRKN